MALSQRSSWQRSGAGCALIMVVALALVSGCLGEDSDDSATPNTPPADPTIIDSASPGNARPELAIGQGGILPPLESPLDAYKLRAADLYTIQAAERQLSTDCLSRFGFEQQVDLPDREDMLAEERESDTRLYGITNLDVAREYGFLPLSVVIGDDDESEPTSDAFNLVYVGNKAGGIVPGQEHKSPGRFGGLEIPPGGCLGEARQALWGTPDAQVKDNLAQNLRNEAYEQSRSDPEVISAFGDWSECMARQGYQDDDPLSGNFNRPDGAKPTDEEINTAVANIECKVEVDLIKRWNAVDVRYQQEAIEDNQLELTELRDRIDDALAKATQVINE